MKVLLLCLFVATPAVELFAQKAKATHNSLMNEDIEVVQISPEQAKQYRAYVTELQAAAKAKKLHERVQWMRLTHFRNRTIFPGVVGEADSESFYQAEDGKTNPESELYATLNAFAFGDRKHPKILHPQCRFVARYHWLSQQLNIDRARLPDVKCVRFNKWRKSLNPESITMVFSSYYANSPASMFGHTLMKLDKKREKGKDDILPFKDRDLLDYGVNFAAHAGDTNMVLYALFGLFGGFPGTFSIYPYYFKVNEYNNYESRDLWEYELNLTQAEVDMILMHIWEMGATYFDYYYFDENCASQLLTLIEVGRPSVTLVDEFWYFIIPADTIRMLETKGMIRKRRYRPSIYTRFRQKYSLLDHTQQDFFTSMLKDGRMPPDDWSLRDRTLLIETAIEYLSFMRNEQQGKLDKNDMGNYNALLLARSKLRGAPSFENLPRLPEARDPISGHNVTQLNFIPGYSSKGPFMSMSITPALRYMTDNPRGYQPYTQLIFFGVEASYFPEVDELPQLERFRLVEVISLHPMSSLLANKSWTVGASLKNQRKEIPGQGSPNKIYFAFNGGAGGGYHTNGFGYFDNFMFFALGQGFLDVGTGFDPAYRIAPAINGGIIWQVTGASNFKLEGIYKWYLLGDRSNVPIVSTIYNYSLGQSFALELSYERYFESRYWETGLNIKYYF